MFFNDEVRNPLDAANDLLGKVISDQVAMTNQSDAWLILALTGPLVFRTLERICPIDCRSLAMPIGSAARTMIDNLGTIIFRRPNDSNGSPCFWLISARSTAASFLHVIKEAPPFSS